MNVKINSCAVACLTALFVAVLLAGLLFRFYDLSDVNTPSTISLAEAKLRFVHATGISIPSTAQVLSCSNSHCGFDGSGEFSIVFQVDHVNFAGLITNKPPWSVTNWSQGPVAVDVGRHCSFARGDITPNHEGKQPTYVHGPKEILELYQRTNVWWVAKDRTPRERLPAGYSWCRGDFILLDPKNHQVWYSDWKH
jgi:hypothetical protein